MSTTQKISRSAAKAKVREIRASAAKVSNLLDTMAKNPDWAETYAPGLESNLAEFLNEIDGTCAQLRDGLGLEQWS